MSHTAVYPHYETLEIPHATEQAASSGYLPRSKFIPLPFLVPVMLSGLSWLAGGLPRMTDVAFLLLTILCIAGVINELFRFPKRFGTAGFLLFGGVLVWFCYDYMVHWFGVDFQNDAYIPAVVIAKAAFFHSIMVCCLTAGILIQRGGRLERILFFSIPEPRTSGFFFGVVVFLSMVGIAPYFVFSAESLGSITWKLLSLNAANASWAYGRSGNLNYNWGGYIAELLNVGTLGALLGTFYAILISKSWGERIVCGIFWLHNAAYAFYTSRRGPVIFLVLPPLILLFLKHQDAALQQFRRFSIKAYVVAGALLFGTLLVVQTQIHYRGGGLGSAKLSEVSLTKIEGNAMFSEGLTGYQLVPDVVPFFGNRWPGEGVLRPIPEFLFWLAVHPIPRALWHSKPIDPLWEWYNSQVAGTGTEGTTISKGLVGWWYFRFGVFGVIEGGILMGWLMGLAERAFQHAQGRPIVIMLALSFDTWLFRCYRDVGMLELYTLVVGAVVLWAVMKVAPKADPV